MKQVETVERNSGLSTLAFSQSVNFDSMNSTFELSETSGDLINDMNAKLTQLSEVHQRLNFMLSEVRYVMKLKN